MHRSLSLIVLTLVIAVALAAPALAADPYEPNDTRQTAFGPIGTTEYYAGEIATAEDRDLFWFETSTAGTVTITLDGGDTCTSGALQVFTAKGATSGNASDSTGDVVLTHSLLASGQYAVQVTASAGCPYTLDIEPASIVVDRPLPTAVAFLDRTRDVDTVQRVLVDGTLVGEAAGGEAKWVPLESLAGDARITFESENASASWAWNAVITSAGGASRSVIFSENEFGLYRTAQRPAPAARIGIVRHVVLTPSGAALESCGERNAPAPCFPVDDDLDGIPNASDQCTMQAGPAAAGGCPDRDGDAVADAHDSCADVAGPVASRGCPDADGDGVGDPLDKCPALAGPAPSGCPPQRNYVTTVSLRHRGKRFTGRVLSAGPGCVAGRVVVLHRAGKRAILGKATARANGAFTIVAPKARRGPFYVTVQGKRETRKLCRTASSRSVR